jgi:hypothetical protein
MQLDQKQIDMLSKMGSNFFSHAQCAVVLEVDSLQLRAALKDQRTEAYKAYYKAYFMSMVKLRESIMELAQRGSSPAQAQILKIIEQTVGANV